MVLPSGFVVPDVPYLVALGLGSLLTTLLLWGLEPPVTKNHVFAFSPWIAVGGITHAFYQITVPPAVTSPPGLYPEWVAPLFSAPAVYVTLYVVVGIVWLVLIFVGAIGGALDRTHLHLGITGLGVLVVFLTAMVWQGLEIGLSPTWPIVGLVLAVPITAVAYFLLSIRWTSVVAQTGLAGAAVVFAHVFDGVITAIGYDVLGASERTPLPAAIMAFAGDLPTAAYLGSGWLFVVIKVIVATLVVAAVADIVDERPAAGSLLLTFVAAFGLGPATNNFVLFFLG
ncbi:DUF63 family protein [Halorhabdus amylolytica]|uniref:DUF63 family protein n=1 Tax=Halorhabdus amylolytica TaxID=2559573 RepID=UPI0010AAE380|nr:DUF63 family protein [Halorhabdus amylolytica]